MEDFRQNLLREHQHLRIDASQKQMVSPIWRAGGTGFVTAKGFRADRSWNLPVWKNM
jgi:hypothetical protein